MMAARLLAAAIIARATEAARPYTHPYTSYDAHVVAHQVLELERELHEAEHCQPPEDSYRSADLTCAYGWRIAQPQTTPENS